VLRKLCEIELLGRRQRRTLIAVLAINAMMFVTIFIAAIHASSSALLSDSLDNLGDALTYGLSLYAVGRGDQTKASVALFKGSLILLAALGVLVQVGYKVLHPKCRFLKSWNREPAGLAANGVCLLLLMRHRHEDVNMSSVWNAHAMTSRAILQRCWRLGLFGRAVPMARCS